MIGGGPAGLAAAISAWEAGLRDILIVERDRELGGILNQCVHTGFGLSYFNEELTGPEYAGRFIAILDGTGVDVSLDTMALKIISGEGGAHGLHTLSKREGYREIKAETIILAMGCRERTRGAIGIPGTRPSGIMTAGTAQRYINIEGYMVGKRALILGSGDVGLIMARRMTLEGAKVLACIELMPHYGGLNRNIEQCLRDFNIPLYLSHTITDIRGSRRVEGATVSRVDARGIPIPGSEMDFECDTILLSVGLIPENELSRQAGIEIDPRSGGAVVYENRETSIPGIFACGNVLHVHDLVDFVSTEGILAGKSAAAYVLKGRTGTDAQGVADTTNATDAAGVTDAGIQEISLHVGEGVSYVVPRKIHADREDKQVSLSFRANRVFAESAVILRRDEREILRYHKERLVPGEMETVNLPVGIVTTGSGKADATPSVELTISIEEAGK